MPHRRARAVIPGITAFNNPIRRQLEMDRKLIFILGLMALATPCAFADEPDFVPGRPGNTESPISVPDGRWQIETEIASYSHDKADGAATNTWGAAATSFRYGVGPNADIEMIAQPYMRVSGGGTAHEGFGDVTLRARRSFVGEGGGPAFAVIGYVTMPTSQDHLGASDFEGGLIATGAMSLSSRVSMTLTAGAGAASGVDDKQKADFFGGANIGYSFNAQSSTYVEVFTDKTEDAETVAVIQGGVTYLWTSTTQLDAGVELGITEAADDCRFFVGWAHRF